ncbi:MAG: tail fiber domain-containing protein [Luteolibacter sp.]
MISRKSYPSLIAFLAVFAALVCGPASAALPQVLNHQGRIAVQGVNFDGNGQFKFALVNADGTLSYWSNDGSGVQGGEPTAAVTLSVNKGLYAVLLGNPEVPNMTTIPPSALQHEDVRLRVWFNDGALGFQQITPDQPLAAVPYAIHAQRALAADTFGGHLAGDVTGGQSSTAIADATVTGKRLTGFASGTGLVSADDSLLSAIGKLHGNAALLAPLASPTFTGTVGGITAGMVGLGNVNNTSDADKPVSTLQQAALDLKAPLASPTFTGVVSFSAGTAITAPIRLATGTNLSTPVPGAVEFDGSLLYITTSPATRKALAYADSTEGGIAAGRLIAAPLSPVLGWGSRSQGQTTVPVLSDVAAVSAGREHSLALLRSGAVQAWGRNAETQTTVPAAALSGVTGIAAGFEHNLACKSDGTLVAWGESSYGRTAVPDGITTATNVAAGGLHSLALLANGTVRAWGDSTFGQATVPGNLTAVTAIAAGEFHSLALKSDGQVVAWGSDSIGQIAIPDAALSGVTAIAAGWNHSLALKGGSVLAWGLNTGGQTDVPAGASSGVVQIAAGDTYSLALKSDGTVIAWGFTGDVDPVTVVPAAATRVTQIAAGGYHALALRADTVPVEFARLDDLGRLGIGRTPTTYALEVNGNAWKSTAGAWLSNSDRRIKTGIESIEGALEKLDQVRLVDFRYTDDYLAAHPEIEDRRYPNVIAQEFAAVFPDDVKGSGELLADGSEILQVDTYPLTIYSAAAIQELHRENQKLRQKIASQEERLRKLETLLNAR